ncbi:MAG: ATP-binding protein [Anaerolinea sp.]|nr:ATP-binding protein [Anaerolinea sp.]
MNIDKEGILQLSAGDLIGQSVSILGIKGSGKSNTAAVLMEELLAGGVPICVVDIAGEYHTLKTAFPQVTVIGRSIETETEIAVTPANVDAVAQASYAHGRSVVFDLSGIPSGMREDLLQLYFARVWREAALRRIPLVIFLEEAQNWIPQRKTTTVKSLLVDIAAEGRKRGLSLVIIGQRSARIDKDTLTQSDISFLHRVRHPTDVNVYVDMLPRPATWVRDRVYSLHDGEALVMIGDRVLRCKIRLRHTEHVGFTPTLAHVPSVQLSLLDLLGQGG